MQSTKIVLLKNFVKKICMDIKNVILLYPLSHYNGTAS